MPANHADATTRFSNRVRDYVRFRPGYPPQVVQLLSRAAKLNGSSVIADIGSGTGLLARAFLEAGYGVIGIEPNPQMREAGGMLLASFPGFQSRDASAEATTLPGATVDLAMAGQAFHWFRVAEARKEWVRILKPGGVAALIWNERHIASPFMRDTEAVIDEYASELDPDGSIREGGRSRIGPFFAPAPFYLDEFPHVQEFGFEGLLGRIASCSYIPMETDARYREMAAKLRRVFERHERDGQISFEYQTKVYWGRLSGA